MDVLVQLEELLTTKGRRRYGLHDVSQLQHALQAAWLGADPPLIAAALLHDIGHMMHELRENPAGEGIDDPTRRRGISSRAAVSARRPPSRAGCMWRRSASFARPNRTISPRSLPIWHLVSSCTMSAAEVAAFRADPHAEAAVRLRRFDEAAKVKDLETPPVPYFMQAVAACLPPPGYSP